MNKKIKLTITILITLIIQTQSFAKTKDDRYPIHHTIHEDKTPTLESIFSHLSYPQLKAFINILTEELSLSTKNNKKTIQCDTPQESAGYNIPYLTPFHYQILADAKDQAILEIGPGRGYFTAKLAIAGAKNITAIELMKAELNELPTVIENYEKQIKISIHDKIQTQFGNAENVLDTITFNDKPTRAILLNVLHYNSPKSCIKLFKKLYKITHHDGKIYGIANAFSPNINFKNCLEKTYQKQKLYAGYMMMDSKHYTSIHYHKNNYKEQFDESDEKYREIIAFHPISIKQDIPPYIKFNGHYDPTFQGDIKARLNLNPQYTSDTINDPFDPSTLTSTLKHQTFFFIDIPSLTHMLDISGWVLEEVFYSDPSILQKNTVNITDLNDIKNDLNIFFIAKKKTLPHPLPQEEL